MIPVAESVISNALNADVNTIKDNLYIDEISQGYGRIFSMYCSSTASSEDAMLLDICDKAKNRMTERSAMFLSGVWQGQYQFFVIINRLNASSYIGLLIKASNLAYFFQVSGTTVTKRTL